MVREVANAGALSVVQRNPLQEVQARVSEVMAQPAVRRSMPLLLLLLTMAVGLGCYLLLQQPSLRELYPGLVEADRAGVLELLKEKGIKVELERMTGTLMVPEEQYHNARMVLAQEGLPRTVATGYELLTEMPVGTSQSVEQARLRQSMETELARTISHIEPIESARVHLAIAPRSALVRETPEAHASVVLRIASGRSLGEGQVAAIVHLVGSSVPFLPSSNVTVVDQHGKLLSAASTDAAANASDKQLKHQMQVERMYRERILTLLSPIVGYQNLSAEVTASIDFTKMESTTEKFDEPERLRSEQSNTSERSDAEARGVPGTLSNTPPPAPEASAPPTAAEADATRAGPTTKSSSTTRNFEIGRELKTVQAPGSFLRKLNVAVIVRETPPSPADAAADDEGAQEEASADEGGVPATQGVDTAQLEKLVKDAVGYDESRGDSVTVSALPFAEPVTGAGRRWYEASWVSDAAKSLAGAVVIAVLAFGLLRPLAPRLFESPAGLAHLDNADLVTEAAQLESLTLAPGETLEDLKAKLKPKKKGISAELLDTANTYDDKVAVVRMLVGEDAARVTNVFKQLMRSEIVS